MIMPIMEITKITEAEMTMIIPIMELTMTMTMTEITDTKIDAAMGVRVFHYLSGCIFSYCLTSSSV